MEVAAGAAVSAINGEEYNKRLKRHVHLQKSLELHTYTAWGPLGVCKVKVINIQATASVRRASRERTRPLFLAANGSRRSNCNGHVLLHIGTKQSLQEILDSHAVFSTGLGKMKDIKAWISLKDDYKPRF